MRIKFKAFYFIQFLSYGILGPYLSLYLSEKGFTGTQIGLMLGVMSILSVVLQPVWSYLSDVFSKRRPLLIVACVGVSISMLGFGFVETFLEAFLLSLLYSVFIAPTTTISTAIVLDYLEEVGKPEEFSLFRVWGSIAYAISSLLWGSLFLDQILVLFPWILAGIYLSLALLSGTLPECEKSLSKATLKDLKATTANTAFMLFLAGGAFIGATINIGSRYQTLFLQSLNTPDLLLGVIIALPAILEVPMMTVVPIILRRISMRWLILVAVIITPIRWMIYFLIQEPGWLIPVQLLGSIVTIGFEVVGVSFIDEHIDQKWRATGQGLYTSFLWGIGPAIGSYAAGYVLDWLSVRAIWGLNVIMGVIGLILVAIALWRFKPSAKTVMDHPASSGSIK